MSNPLSHVGQSPHPEVSKQVEEHCVQAQSQQQQQQQQQQQPPQSSDTGPSDARAGDPAEKPPSSSETSEPPATRLPQHPQPQDAPEVEPDDQQRPPHQGETRARDTSLPAPTDAD